MNTQISDQWELLETAQSILKYPNPINKCRRVSRGSVEIKKGKNGDAYYDNLITCKSAWSCPFCSYKRAREKAAAINELDSRLMYKRVMITYTVQHNIKDRLDDLLDILYNSLRLARIGRYSQEFYSIAVGYIRSTEILYGKNGWHAHIHEMIYLKPGATAQDVINTVAKHYKYAVEKAGKLINQHTVDVKEWYGDSGYVTKNSEIKEITGFLKKDGRNSINVFGILRVAEDSERHRELYKEYYWATKSRKITMVSRSLMSEYKKCVESAKDGEENDDETIFTMDNDMWKKIRSKPMLRYNLLAVLSETDRNHNIRIEQLIK